MIIFSLMPASLTSSHWFIIGIILMIFEALLPATFFLWMGISAIFMGGLVWFMPFISSTLQILLFAGCSLVSVGIWKFFTKYSLKNEKKGTFNKRTDFYIGRQFVLPAPIVQGRGRLKIEESWWTIEGPDLPAGVRVIITETEGLILKVKLKE